MIFTVGNVIQVRKKETDTAKPRMTQTLGTIATATGAKGYAIDFARKKTTVSVPATIEYNTISEDAETWTASTGAALALTSGTTYYFRTAATETVLAGNVQTLIVPQSPTAPDTTVVTIAAGNEASHTKLTLADTYEYVLAITSPTASTPGTVGTGSAKEVAASNGQHVYVRFKAVASTSFASDWVECGDVQLGVNNIPLTGVGYDVAAKKLTGTTANMEYQIANGTWTACTAPDTVGVAFAAGTVKVRQKDKTTNERTVATITAAAASKSPTLGSKTYNSVTISPMADYEYSKDGGLTRQDSNVFSGLDASTEYSFVTRVKATKTALHSSVSTALTVKTDAKPSSGGGSSGGSSSTVTVPVIGSGTKVNTDVATSGSTVTVKEPTTTNLDKVIAAAEKDKKAVVIDLSSLSNSLSTVTLPANTIVATGKSAENGGISGLRAMLPKGNSVTFDRSAAPSIADVAKGRPLTLSIDERALSKQTADETALLGDRTSANIFDLTLKDSRGNVVSDFEGGTATVVLKNIKMTGKLSDYALFHKAGGKLETQSFTRTATGTADVFDLTIPTTGWSSYMT